MWRWPNPGEYGSSLNDLLSNPEPVYYCDGALRNTTPTFLNIHKGEDVKGIRVKSLKSEMPYYQEGVFSSL